MLYVYLKKLHIQQFFLQNLLYLTMLDLLYLYYRTYLI